MSINKQIIKKRNSVYYFVIALIMYSVVQLIIIQFSFLSNRMYGLIELGSMVMMVFFAKKILTDFEFENQYFKFIFTIFMIYSLIIFIRGFEMDYEKIMYYLQTDHIFWPLVIPLVVFLNKDDLTFFYFLKSFYILGIAFLFISAVDSSLIRQRITSEPFIMPFAFTCGFLFLNTKYVSKKVSLVALISLLLGLLSFIYLARRNAILSFGGLLIVGFYFILRNFKTSRIIRLFPVFIGLLLLVLFIINDLPEALTSKVNERLKEDTRTELFVTFFKKMEGDMIFGRGMNGSYYLPVDETTLEDGVTFSETEYRNLIENGYLQLLLNGGYVYFVLFVLTLLPAAYLGIFKSNNQLTKTCGVVVFLWMVDMSVFGLPRLLMQYILVWMAVGICYKNSFRDRTDEEIIESFEAVGLA